MLIIPLIIHILIYLLYYLFKGKFIRIYFNQMGKLAGGFIDVYLLEKSRVTYQQDNERCYHIFFQLVEEGPVPGLKSLCLLSDDIYDYFFVSQVTYGEMLLYINVAYLVIFNLLYYHLINIREKPRWTQLMTMKNWNLLMVLSIFWVSVSRKRTMLIKSRHL